MYIYIYTNTYAYIYIYIYIYVYNYTYTGCRGMKPSGSNIALARAPARQLAQRHLAQRSGPGVGFRIQRMQSVPLPSELGTVDSPCFGGSSSENAKYTAAERTWNK